MKKKKLLKNLFMLLTIGVLVSATCGAAHAAGSITGTVQYEQWTAGTTIRVGVFSDAQMNQMVVDTLLPGGPGPFEILDITAGTYYIAAFCDINGDSEPGMEEPFGTCPDNPAEVTEGQNTSLSTIILSNDDPPGGADVEVLYFRSADVYTLEFIAGGDLTGITGVQVTGPDGSDVTNYALLYNSEYNEYAEVYPAGVTYLTELTAGDYTFTFTGDPPRDPEVVNFQPVLMELPTVDPVTYPNVTWPAVTDATEYYLII